MPPAASGASGKGGSVSGGAAGEGGGAGGGAAGKGGAAGQGGGAGGGAAGQGGTGKVLPGWELEAGLTGLARVGLSCAGLAPYAGPKKPPAGTVISERRVEAALDLSAGDITIERSCIRPTTIGHGLHLVTTTDNDHCTKDGCAPTTGVVTIRDSEIDGSQIALEDAAYACAFIGVGVLLRNDIHGMGSGICFFNTGHTLDAIAEGNLVHALRASGDPAGSGSHNEALTIRDFDRSQAPSRRARVRYNRLDCQTGNDTGALFIQTYGGDIDGVTLEGNLLSGGGYQLILEAGFGHVYGEDMGAMNNRFSGTGYGPGYADGKGLGYGFSVWEDNAIDDPSKPDHKGKPLGPL